MTSHKSGTIGFSHEGATALNLPAADKTTQPFLPYYEVLEALGEGAVATVHKVRSINDGAVFALKSLKPRYATTERAVKRFEDEFRVLHRLHHPGLPEVFDYGITEDGTRYIVMELVEGVPLGSYFADNKDDFWLLVYQLTEGLSFIHEHKLLHLDLKPGNVLIEKTRAYGEKEMPLAVLLDFGVSYRRDEGGEAKMIGTPAYMPPEIIRGEENPTRAADYYSLGVMLYEMVEGKAPFTGTMDDVLRAHLTKKVEFGKTAVAYAAVYPWIEKLMSKEPAERLEAFGDFRRMVGERVAGSVVGLERAYALGFIESLGLFGKRQIWETVVDWGSRMTSRRGARETEAVSSTESTPIELSASETDFAARVREDLLSASKGEDRAGVPDPQQVQRYMNVTGPPESGKAFLLQALRAHLLPGGHRVIALDDPQEYGALLRMDEGKGTTTDPRVFAVERFKRGWERIAAQAERGGAVVSVQHYEALPLEARQFIEYVIKRVELSASEGSETGVFIVVASESPHTKKELCSLIANESNCLAVEIPPPGKADVETILDEFHGHMSGADERRKLSEYLETNLTTDGAVMTSLRHAVTEGGLIYRGGHWEFHGVTALLETDGGSNEYYRQLLPELPPLARSLAEWLSCHPGRLTVEQVASISGMKPAEVRRAIAELRPYRLLDVVASDGTVEIRFTSNGVREAIYSTLDGASRSEKHNRFVDYMAERPLDSRDDIESITHHYEHLDRRRDAMLARVRAVRLAKQDGDVHSVRRLCAAGAAYARQDKGDWLAERYFIKSLVDAEWAVSNYSGIAQAIEENFTKRGRDVPPSFLYKYAYALDSSGRFDELGGLIANANVVPALSRSLRDQMRVIEASSLYTRRRFHEALNVLKQVRADGLPWWVVGKFYTMSALVHGTLGNKTEHQKYVSLLTELTEEKGDHEHLLRINYHEALAMLGRTRYEPAKKLLARSIRVASRNRAYRSLSTMYYAASGVYYEEADYTHALKYLDKAIRLGTELGMLDHVYAYRVRQGSSLRELGRYGTVIRHLESLARILPAEHHFFAQLILLDTYTLLHSDRADYCTDLIVARSSDVRPGIPVALFHYLYGNRLLARDEPTEARAEYDMAVDLYSSAGAEDDWVKTKIAIARTHLAEGVVDHAVRIMDELSAHMRRMESTSVRGGYDVLRMLCALNVGDSDDILSAARALEVRRQMPGGIATKMNVCAALLEARIRTQDLAGATECFGHYYSMMKEICSDLSDRELLRSYATNVEFTRLLDMFRRAKKESPD